MILQSNSIKRGDWLLIVPLDSGHLVKFPHRAGRLIANEPLFMLLLIKLSLRRTSLRSTVRVDLEGERIHCSKRYFSSSSFFWSFLELFCACGYVHLLHAVGPWTTIPKVFVVEKVSYITSTSKYHITCFFQCTGPLLNLSYVYPLRWVISYISS